MRARGHVTRPQVRDPAVMASEAARPGLWPGADARFFCTAGRGLESFLMQEVQARLAATQVSRPRPVPVRRWATPNPRSPPTAGTVRSGVLLRTKLCSAPALRPSLPVSLCFKECVQT